MNCEKCQNSLPLNAKFCGKCGEPVKGLSNENLNISKKPISKCGNCGHVGEAESNRSLWAQILAWLCLFGFWIVTILYFATTKKYRCQKCKSTFIGIKDKNGNFVDQKTSVLKVIVFLVLGIALIGILSSVILASLNTAREKAVQQEYPAGWTTYNAVSDGFSILVPHSPSFESSSDVTDSGISYEYHSYSAEKGSQYFLVAKYIYSEPIDVSDPDNFLEILMNGFVSGSESKLTSSNYTNHKTYRSLDFTSKTASETFMGRILLVGETPYLLIAGYPTGSNGSFDYIKFVDSFEVK